MALALPRGDQGGRGRIKTQPGKSCSRRRALHRRDSGAGVTDYPGSAPWPFTGGTIKRVGVDVSGETVCRPGARSGVAMMMRE